MQAKTQWDKILKVLTEKNCQHRLPYPAKISFKNEEEIKIFFRHRKEKKGFYQHTCFTGNVKRSPLGKSPSLWISGSTQRMKIIKKGK